MRILGILLLTVTFFSVGCSHYGKRKCKGKMHEKHFKAMDKDADGSVSKKEFQGHTTEMWTAMDADKNGKVTMEEMKAHHKAMHAKKCTKKDCTMKDCKGC